MKNSIAQVGMFFKMQIFSPFFLFKILSEGGRNGFYQQKLSKFPLFEDWIDNSISRF